MQGEERGNRLNIIEHNCTGKLYDERLKNMP